MRWREGNRGKMEEGKATEVVGEEGGKRRRKEPTVAIDIHLGRDVGTFSGYFLTMASVFSSSFLLLQPYKGKLPRTQNS